MSDFRPLGTTGVQVHPLALGTMMFGTWGNADHADCARMVHRALDAGINVIDTADVYGRGESEEIVGKALKGRRDAVVLATKFGGPMSEDPNTRGASRRWAFRAVEGSLRRLGADHIDLYQIHLPDPAVDIEETLAALSDLVTQGKVRYVGTSNFAGSAIVAAQWAADRRLSVRPVSEQPPYSILARDAERDILPTAMSYGMGILSWSPLAGGWLSGRYRRGDNHHPESSRLERQPDRHDPRNHANQLKLNAVNALQDLADEAGLPLIHLSLAFVLEHPAVTSVILGPRTLAQLDGQLGAESVRLPADVLDRIDKIVAPGCTLNEADRGAGSPRHLAEARMRRRPGDRVVEIRRPGITLSDTVH